MPRRFVFALAAIFAPIAAAADEVYETSAGPVRVEEVASGLSQPWGFAFLPGGGQIITEKGGTIRIARGGAVSAPIEGAPEVSDAGQGGLLDIALARDFTESGELYLSYAARAEGGDNRTTVARARLVGEGGDARLEDLTVIFRQTPASGGGRHYGSRIVVTEDGSLFVTVGDRGDADQAQVLSNHQGSIVRITRDGDPHPDNPFLGSDRGWAPEIYSFGHRNPQGAALGPDGTLWTIEHGPRGGDELNRPAAGVNHGWPVIGYGVHYSGARIGVGQTAIGMAQPIHFWDPSIAPSGLAIYDGEMFPEWRGDALVGALKFQLLARLDIADGAVIGEERLFAGEFGRIRDVRVAPDGAIWFATDSRNGGLYRISRVN